MSARSALPLAALPIAALSFAGLLSLPMAGCSLLDSVKNGVKTPTATLASVDLIDAPTNRQAIAWACYEWLNSTTCEIAGFNRQPSAEAMGMSFDLVFDLTNPNDSLPIPLVELLLGITVIEDTNLGAVCVTFCDADTEDCSAEQDAEEACAIDDDTTDVKGPEDLIPSVDDLVDLADGVLSGDESNSEFRTIPPNETIESHIRFDLQIETIYRLGESLLMDAIDDFIDGRNIELVVPYSVDGTLFFDAPKLGRYALGFGPYADTFPLGN
jgi:hypothetical protein